MNAHCSEPHALKWECSESDFLWYTVSTHTSWVGRASGQGAPRVRAINSHLHCASLTPGVLHSTDWLRRWVSQQEAGEDGRSTQIPRRWFPEQVQLGDARVFFYNILDTDTIMYGTGRRAVSPGRIQWRCPARMASEHRGAITAQPVVSFLFLSG